MKAKTKTARIGFRVHVGKRDNPYCPGLKECVAQVWQFDRKDAAKDFAEAVKRDRYVDDSAARAKVIADATKDRSTVYYTKPYRETTADIRWIANTDDGRNPNDYFGATISSSEFNEGSIELLGYLHKLLKADGVYIPNCQPRQLIAALTKAGAICVKYIPDGLGVFVEDGDFNLDAALPLPESQRQAPTPETEDVSGTDAPYALTPEQDVQATNEPTSA